MVLENMNVNNGTRGYREWNMPEGKDARDFNSLKAHYKLV
jgi:hypothetical protein